MKKIFKNILLVLFFIVIIAVVGIVIYSITSNKKILGDIIPVNSSNTVDDYHNGVYYFEEPLSKSYSVYNGCNVSSFDSYIVVMNDKYYAYYGSCMKNTKIDEGKTEDLVFSVDKASRKYQITYKDKVYKKNDKVNSVVESNYLAHHFNSSTLEVVDFVLKYGNDVGEYNPINVALLGCNTKYTLSFKYNEESQIFVEKIKTSDTEIYSYSYLKIDDRPQYDFIENSLAVLEKNVNNADTDNYTYRYNLVLLGEGKKKFELSKEFPITINGVRIDLNKNIYVMKKDKSTYRMLVGNNNTFCDNDKKDSEDVSYYEFDIKYNYTTKNFDSPELVKIGKYSEGCNYVNKYYFGG